MDGSDPKIEATRLERVGEVAARVGSLQPSDPNLRRALHAGIAVVLVLGAAFAIVAALGDFPDVEWRLLPAAIGLGLLGTVGFLVASAEIWRRILHALGPEVPPLRAQSIWFASGLGRYVPTSLLLPMLRVAMTERSGAAKRITLASTVYEFALFLAANVIVAAYFVVTLDSLSGEPWRLAVLAIPVVVLIGLQPRFFHPLADRALARLGRDGLPAALPASRVFGFVCLYVLVCLIGGLSLYGFGETIHPLGVDDLPAMVGAFAVGTTFSIVGFLLPGGLVARETAIALALSSIMPPAPALAIAVVSRIAQLALEVALAVALPVVERRREARQSAITSTAPLE